MISCLLLSAGHSSRFGSPKALAKLAKRTVIEQVQENLVSSFVDEVIVVLGAYAQEIQPCLLKHKKVKAVYNKDYNFGQTSSVQAGVRAISERSDGIMVLPVDYSFIRMETFNQLVEKFLDKRPKILIPTYEDQKGHPPIFDISLKKNILALDKDVGLNEISRSHPEAIYLFFVEDKAVRLTFNTAQEFEEIKKII